MPLHGEKAIAPPQLEDMPAPGASAPSEAPTPPDSRIYPPPVAVPAEDAERPDGWGFRDTEFRINEADQIELSGPRYEVSGVLPDLLPWLREQTQLPFAQSDRCPSQYPPAVPPAVPCPEFLAAVSQTLAPDAITHDDLTRLGHAHGQTMEEIYRVRHGALDRVPDVVLFPASEAQVEAIVDAAQRHGVCLIPYGGGTSVTEALRCPSGERRPIASIDMSRMRRIVWIDPENHMVRIEAGAVGRHIQSQLAEYGFTLGHEPDSLEFSTLGGWIATHASGMKKNRYGNIESMLLDVSVVTARGTLRRPGVSPRESSGLDPRRWVLGSEGGLGIITAATLRIFPLPEVQRYGSILFHAYEEGIAFLYDLQKSGPLPASVRLVDNVQFRFGQALHRRRGRLAALVARAQRAYVTGLRGFVPDRMTACTLVFEGTRAEVREQERRTYAIARAHRGLRAGAANGRRGYELTFGIAYIRDLAMQNHVVADSFETSVAWSDVSRLLRNVERKVFEEHARRKLPGRPFFCSRITQLYATGVCVYFYLGLGSQGVAEPGHVFAEVDRAVRAEILRCGGSLSHHHGVGKIRQGFLPHTLSSGELEWIRHTKQALDPAGVFGAANQAYARIDPEDPDGQPD